MKSSERQRYKIIYDISLESFKVRTDDYSRLSQKIIVLLTIIIPFNAIVLGVLFAYTSSINFNLERLWLSTFILFCYLFTHISAFLISLSGFKPYEFKRLALDVDMDKYLEATEEKLYSHFIDVFLKIYKDSNKSLKDITDKFEIAYYLFVSGIFLYFFMWLVVIL